MKTRLFLLTIMWAVVVVFSHAGLVHAGSVPLRMVYQGRLLEASGAPAATGDYVLKFRLYDKPTGGELVWGPQIFDGPDIPQTGHGPKIPVVDGRYHVILGPQDEADRPLSTSFDGIKGVGGPVDDSTLYLEIQVGDSTPIAPRQKLLNAPFALHAHFTAHAQEAQNAQTLAGHDWSAILARGNDPTASLIDPDKLRPSHLDASDGNPTNVVVVDGQGKVGVGIQTPTEKLDVNGDLFANGPIGTDKVMIDAQDGAGTVQTFGANGEANVTLGSVLGFPDLGLVSLHNSQGIPRVAMVVSTNGEGILSLLGSRGQPIVLLGGHNNGTIEVNKVPSATPGVRMFAGSTAGSVVLNGPAQSNVWLGSPTSNSIVSALKVNNSQGDSRCEMSVSSGDLGKLTLSGSNGRRNVVLWGGSDFPPCPGFFSVVRPFDHGFLTVYDEGDCGKAGFYLDDDGRGVAWGDQKTFRVDHPTRPGSKIVYVCLEGPEVAMYHRGRVTLEKGEATIQLPEHFSVLANLDTLTVNLTAQSFESKGLGVFSVSQGGVQIGELFEGTGSYDVHFMLTAVRKGYEDHKPVVPKEALFESAGGLETSTGKQVASRPNTSF